MTTSEKNALFRAKRRILRAYAGKLIVIGACYVESTISAKELAILTAKVLIKIRDILTLGEKSNGAGEKSKGHIREFYGEGERGGTDKYADGDVAFADADMVCGAT